MGNSRMRRTRKMKSIGMTIATLKGFGKGNVLGKFQLHSLQQEKIMAL